MSVWILFFVDLSKELNSSMLLECQINEGENFWFKNSVLENCIVRTYVTKFIYKIFILHNGVLWGWGFMATNPDAAL